jgi:hypothetical protein
MFGPPSLLSDAVNAVLRTQKLWFERQMFLLRAESAHYAPPSLRKRVVEIFLAEQAAVEAGLGSIECEPELLTEERKEAFVKATNELRELLDLAELVFP